MSHLNRREARVARRAGPALLLILLLASSAAVSAAAPVPTGGARAGTDFNSSFNVHHNGWTLVSGSWEHVASAVFYTAGTAGERASIVHTGAYGDFTYEARMKRVGCPTCANSLVVRSRPDAESANDFASAFLFQYSNEQGGSEGMFSVFRLKANGSWVVVKGWTYTAAVNPEGWNVLRVEAAGSTFRFYINGTKVWQGTKTAPASGRVGISVYRDDVSTGNGFRVDWAVLTVATPAPAGAALPAPAGATVTGGTPERSPGG
jgi:hypothetical protein